MGLEQMSEYEQQAWKQSLDVIYHRQRRTNLLPAGMREAAGRAVDVAKDRLPRVPGWESAAHLVEGVFEGTLTLTFEPALRSVGEAKVVSRYRKRHPDVRSLDDVRGLGLRERDAFRLPRGGYATAAAIEGGASALAVTGAEVSATVSGGVTAGVVVLSVAADSVASLALMGRAVGRVAAQYGYDVTLPEEELFAMGVLSLSTASSLGAKAQAMTALSRLTQEMMRHATWEQLNKHLLVKVIDRVYLRLGIRLTHRRLAQVVPIAGAVVNSALSAHLADQTLRRAQAVYRLRALSDRYGIDPSEWVAGDLVEPTGDEVEAVVDVAEILDDERDSADEESA